MVWSTMYQQWRKTSHQISANGTANNLRCFKHFSSNNVHFNQDGSKPLFHASKTWKTMCKKWCLFFQDPWAATVGGGCSMKGSQPLCAAWGTLHGTSTSWVRLKIWNKWFEFSLGGLPFYVAASSSISAILGSNSLPKTETLSSPTPRVCVLGKLRVTHCLWFGLCRECRWLQASSGQTRPPANRVVSDLCHLQRSKV